MAARENTASPANSAMEIVIQNAGDGIAPPFAGDRAGRDGMAMFRPCRGRAAAHETRGQLRA